MPILRLCLTDFPAVPMMKMISYFYIMIITGFVEVSTDQANCPFEGCECYRGTIDCEGHNWKSLPTLLVSQTEESPDLNLQHNSLTAIRDGSLPLSLAGINFQYNPLVTIDPAAFDGSSDTLRQLEFTAAKFTQIPTALTHLNTLMSLSIEDTNISTWDVDTMKHIGLTLMYLTLNNVSLTSWPDWIQYYPRLQRLDMTSSFTSIPDNAFDTQANSLTTLQLQNGVLTEISFALTNLSVLTTLVLDYNKITRLNGLPSFGMLSSISIQYNSLSNATHLSDILRPVSDSLISLQAVGNKLRTFPDLSFMKKLQSAYLSHNFISDTSSGSIPSSLLYLEVENNNLRSISGILSGGVNLKYLRLGMNFITSLSGDTIPANISELEISNNLISELTDISFPARSLMDSLVLDYNPISQISPASFSGLTNLRLLSLKGSKLTRLPLALRSLTDLYTLDMSQSSYLVCTCLEKPLRPWYTSRSLACYGDCGPTTIDYFLNTLSVDCP